MHPTHSTFVPDLDMNQPASWSKSANALGLSNPLSHLPQSQQVRRLQQQIQQHKQLQQQSNSPFGSGQSRKRNMSSKPESRHLYQSQQGSGFGSGHQHINIKNSDHNSDDDIGENEDDEEDDDENENDRTNQEGASGFHHHRSASHPQLTHGFSIPGFSGFGPSSPMSPSSPGSIASESSSITAPMLSPSLISPGGGHHPHFPHHHGNSSGIESSLASLASLSVMPTTPTSSSGSGTALPMVMPGRNNRFGSGSGGTYSSNSNTPTTGSFQPQSLPAIYQNQVASSGQTTPSFTAFSSALSQHLQRQQQQQMASTMATMSSSLPAHSGFHQFQQHQFQQQQLQQIQQQQQQQQQQQSSSSSQKTRSRSKSLTIPAPRVIPPTRVIPPRAPQTSAPRKYHGRQTRKLPSAPAVKEDIDPTRRVAHIISEQKRREKINGGFDELKSVIPECAQNTDSKATILRKAVDYILLLEDELRKYTDAYQEAEGIDDDEDSKVQSP
ncbi:hypothetical protein BGZ81_006917 [Podila clonocystis]|nr:hypothetical protein BGZ81_006917 [Podila clonocystis]